MTPRPDREAIWNNKHAAGGKGAVRPRVLTPPRDNPSRETESQILPVMNKSGSLAIPPKRWHRGAQ